MLSEATTDNLIVGNSQLSISDVAKVSRDSLSVCIKKSDELLARVSESAKLVDQAVDNDQAIYGVTTGFGGMANQKVDCQFASDLQNNLLQFLAAGAGKPIDPMHTRGAMLLRANVLLQGKSGVRMELIDRLIAFVNAGITPVVREYGSIGASGDLIPLACIGRAITGAGKSKVHIDEGIGDGELALGKLDLEPIQLRPKEGLALVNGTSFSASIAANATYDSKKLLAVSLMAQAMMMRALLVQQSPFEDFVHVSKPHPGQIWSAKIIKDLLQTGGGTNALPSEQIQDRYSLRCFPQYTGSIVEGLARIQRTIEIEMNSVSDNPLIDVANEEFYQSGNFLGQYIADAMDDLRKHIGLLAKHMDVQIASLVTPEFSCGLTPSLRGSNNRPYNMGLKGLQICGNSIMPMLNHIANPLLAHFPTHAEQYNQNINGLSWGAANLAWKSVELFRQYCSIALLFSVQALDLRSKQLFGHFDGRELLGDQMTDVYETTLSALDILPTKDSPYLIDDSDRWLESDIETLEKALSGSSPLTDAMNPLIGSFNEIVRSQLNFRDLARNK